MKKRGTNTLLTSAVWGEKLRSRHEGYKLFKPVRDRATELNSTVPN